MGIKNFSAPYYNGPGSVADVAPPQNRPMTIVDTIYIDCYSSDKLNIKEQKLKMINIFQSLKNAKHVHLSPSTVELLNESRDMLAKEPCPFKKLEYLNLIPAPIVPAVELLDTVKAYFIKKCPDAVVIAMYTDTGVKLQSLLQHD